MVHNAVKSKGEEESDSNEGEGSVAKNGNGRKKQHYIREVRNVMSSTFGRNAHNGSVREETAYIQKIWST